VRYLAATAFAAVSVAYAHGVHASLTSIQYVEESKSLEIVMVVSADDLEGVLRRDTGKQIEVDRGTEKLIFDYLDRAFEIRTKQQKKLPLTWIGMEVSVQKVTAYLEVKAVPEGPDGLRIRNDVLLNFLDDQVNVVSVKRQNGKGRASEHLFQAAAKNSWQAVKLPN
jgi:hypothetical protein